MFDNARRIVTGHDDRGKSVVLIDGPPGTSLGADGAGLASLWHTRGHAEQPTDGTDRAAEPVRLKPPAGGSRFMLFSIAPEDPSVPRQQLEAQAAVGFAAVGAGDCQPDTTRHPAMHETTTVDYIILLKGSVRLILDNDERDLKPFDVVIQRGTNHAWVNTGTEPALLASVLIDAEIVA